MTSSEQAHEGRHNIQSPPLAMSLIVLVFIASGCSGIIEPTINLVVPDGFVGPILVLEDPHAPAYPQGNMSYQVEMPQSGVLFVKSKGFLDQSARWVVRRKNGDLIPLDYEEATDGHVAMRFGGWRSRNGNAGRLEHFIGTLADFEKCDFSLIPTPAFP